MKKGMNDHDIIPMVSYFKEQGITLRFIEFMDVGSTNGWNFDQVVSKKEIYDIIQAVYPLESLELSYFGEVAKRYRYVGTKHGGRLYHLCFGIILFKLYTCTHFSRR
ncbi:GTP 3',8-cyclase MoaA family protein [Priestia megaterium]|uniref:hypothetical protein n=1 Tax=Priestia megaterium TaxID=1404 RepID=UPI00225DF661|nr:hypothetical protein [Priestia megaterium]